MLKKKKRDLHYRLKNEDENPFYDPKEEEIIDANY